MDPEILMEITKIIQVTIKDLTLDTIETMIAVESHKCTRKIEH